MGDEKVDLNHEEEADVEPELLSEEELGIREEVDEEIGEFSDG